MDYTYIKEHLSDEPNNEVDLINYFERACTAFDIPLRDGNRHLKSMDKLFSEITIAYLKRGFQSIDLNFKSK